VTLASAPRTLRIVDAGPTVPREWDDFVDGHPDGSIFHRSAWLRVLGSTFPFRPVSIMALEGDRVRAVLPLFLVRNLPMGRSLVSTPFGVYGGVLGDGEAADALLAHARALGERLGVRFVELRHERARGTLPVKDLYVTFRRPIHATDEENMAAVPRNQRRSIRVAMKHGLESRVGDLDLLAPFYDVYSQSVRNLGTPVFPRRLFENLLREFHPHAKILGVFHEGSMVAGVLTLFHRDQVLPYYGGAVRRAFPLAANDFMYWSLMCHGRENGYRVFDFGRSKVDSGSYHFKRHWGFEPAPLAYQYCLIRQAALPDLTPRNPAFAWPIRVWRRLPLRLTQWIGPKLVRYFP
jgi:FemAB-related protein (PEP-CTERM system-associated)